MKRLTLFFFLTLFSAITFAEIITLNTPNSQLVLKADSATVPHILYYGDKSANPTELENAGFEAFPAMPAFGMIDMIHLPALQIQFPEGDLNLDLRLADISHATTENAEIVSFVMTDKRHKFRLTLFYKAFKNTDVIETWTEICNLEKKDIVLKRFDSGHLFIDKGNNIWLTHFHGDWAAEAIPVSERLTKGVKTIRNTDGARNAHLDAPEVMLSLDGEPNEACGRTIGAALCWNGNYEIRLNIDNHDNYHLYAGIDPQSSEYVLSPKQTLTTPKLAFAYSVEGMGGVSRSLHRWARECGMMHNGKAVRDILLNSWEGIYFDITEERIIAMIDDIAKLGGELFVMDDGWFGGKYQRNNDSSSLGDWVVDKKKLPNGLQTLTDAAKQRGVKFGIWIEPESTNTKSELYEQHPDWVLQAANKNLNLGRGGTQVVLDLTNPKVQDFIVNTVDKLLSENPDIAYIKWDANASIQNYGSTYLPKHKQSNIYIDYHLGLISVLERIRKKYPDVVIQNCASGGGRANYGLMPYFDEFWVSDNNDALQRIFIQWGTSYFFPANLMAQHIGGSPYHMTGRIVPIKFRADVAMSGRLGLELQPKNMTEQELQQCRIAIKDYKQIRDIVQLGNLYRLVAPKAFQVHPEPLPPAEQDIVALMYVTDNREQAVVFAYSLSQFQYQKPQRVKFSGLDPEKQYTLKELNIKAGEQPCSLNGKTFSGDFLMKNGILIPLNGDYASRVFLLN